MKPLKSQHFPRFIKRALPFFCTSKNSVNPNIYALSTRSLGAFPNGFVPAPPLSNFLAGSSGGFEDFF